MESGTASCTNGDFTVESLLDNNRLLNLPLGGRVDKVYTIGCFDLLHEGHVFLLSTCKALGKQVIAGVHDSRSCYKMKNKVPIETIEQRMLRVKQHADMVFCITSLNAANFFTCIVHLEKGETALFVRGDDAPNFPYRHIVENIMPVVLLPKIPGISSTILRTELFSKIRRDDEGYVSDTALSSTKKSVSKRKRVRKGRHSLQKCL
ncbi:uncharacterized protein LOC106150877 [Lingula anatina]|uniref:Uncharacterized protein LOC106150877 n=1 Tax=Lingula anatina TaxID=7574 RepID=A0A1S3H090_LINAN|nr:uncharacterized protein LOC106150877 [Lingula anatina]|eukprot:XP_013379347.1 uncharacterized protein LOC106150877 [Lingula anatina]